MCAEQELVVNPRMSIIHNSKTRTMCIDKVIDILCNNWKKEEQKKRDDWDKAIEKGEAYDSHRPDINFLVKQYELWLRNIFYNETNETYWIGNKDIYEELRACFE